MDKGFEKEGFVTLKIKQSVAKQFKSYSKRLGKSHSISLLLMLEFFDRSGLSPEEQLGPNMQTLELAIKRRLNAMIAIIKDIEKHQTKPTAAMLQALFESAATNPQSPMRVERKENTSAPKFQERIINERE
ncbi:BfmA/BtgA family mobilization protein [Formosa sp. A9]|uniref:BfmA/BtgA family mobilization protein n=1 Tax=Formosa sp. A9 TaxID=3442641 RepID=UPI003EB8EEFC